MSDKRWGSCSAVGTDLRQDDDGGDGPQVLNDLTCDVGLMKRMVGYEYSYSGTKRLLYLSASGAACGVSIPCERTGFRW